jgi:hypothetical protein
MDRRLLVFVCESCIECQQIAFAQLGELRARLTGIAEGERFEVRVVVQRNVSELT